MIEGKYTTRGTSPRNWKIRVSSDSHFDGMKVTALMSHRTSMDTRSRGKMYSNLRRNCSVGERAPKEMSNLSKTCYIVRKQTPELKQFTNTFHLPLPMPHHTSLSLDLGELTIRAKRKKICIIPSPTQNARHQSPTKGEEDNIVSYYKTKYEGAAEPKQRMVETTKTGGYRRKYFPSRAFNKFEIN